MKHLVVIYLAVVMIFAHLSTADGKEILIMDSFIGGSHYKFLSLLGKELAEKGHNISMLVGDCMWNRIYNGKRPEAILNVQSIQCAISAEESDKLFHYFARKTLTGEMSSVLWGAKLWLGLLDDPEIKMIANLTQTMTTTFLSPEYLIPSLKAAKYDLVVCDLMSPICSIMAHDVLNVPYVNIANGGPLGTRYTRWSDTPSPLSYVPEYLTHFTDSMTYLQRVKNVIMHALSVIVYDIGRHYWTDAQKKEMGYRKETSMLGIWRNSALFILNWDFILEYPRPTQPNVVFAGGVTVRSAQPLTPDFEEFVQGSGDDGVVVFSVSTLTNLMDDDMADMIATALARVPLRVIWKFAGERRPSTLGNNTLLAGWLPQGDLLGHNKTKLFMYHGGINGAYEAIYHGVPVVGIPLFADQIDNLLRLWSLGMAEYVKGGIREVNSDTLYQLIMKVVSNPSYKRHAVAASERYRAQPQKPLEKATFWINHVLNHGAEHLRTKSRELSWIQYHMLDVAGVLAIPFVLFIWGVRFCLSALCCRAKSAGEQYNTRK